MSKPAERGPFRAQVWGDVVVVVSDDFTHDAVLQVSGDFSREQALGYAEWVAEVLTRAAER